MTMTSMTDVSHEVDVLISLCHRDLVNLVSE